MAAAPQRLFFLDWLRIFAFALLVPYHVGMVYVRWPFHLKSPQASAAIEPLMLLANPWRMSLLFVISGAATALMLARWNIAEGGTVPGRWLRQRLRRLLLPLLLGMLVIVPPQSYIEVLHRYSFGGSFLDFMPLYLLGDRSFCSAPGHCLILPTWNHLWFLPYLALYTALLWALLRLWPERYQSMSLQRALWRLFCTPRIYKDAMTLVDPHSGSESLTLQPASSR